jgi:dihydrofolate reductase
MKGARRVSIIAAVAENGVIGRQGTLPWRIPEDFRFYLDKVRDQIIILGYRCYHEADHPAALTIALSLNPQWQPPALKVPFPTPIRKPQSILFIYLNKSF